MDADATAPICAPATTLEATEGPEDTPPLSSPCPGGASPSKEGASADPTPSEAEAEATPSSTPPPVEEDGPSGPPPPPPPEPQSTHPHEDLRGDQPGGEGGPSGNTPTTPHPPAPKEGPPGGRAAPKPTAKRPLIPKTPEGRGLPPGWSGVLPTKPGKGEGKGKRAGKGKGKGKDGKGKKGKGKGEPLPDAPPPPPPAAVDTAPQSPPLAPATADSPPEEVNWNSVPKRRKGRAAERLPLEYKEKRVRLDETRWEGLYVDGRPQARPKNATKAPASILKQSGKDAFAKLWRGKRVSDSRRQSAQTNGKIPFDILRNKVMPFLLPKTKPGYEHLPWLPPGKKHNTHPVRSHIYDFPADYLGEPANNSRGYRAADRTKCHAYLASLRRVCLWWSWAFSPIPELSCMKMDYELMGSVTPTEFSRRLARAVPDWITQHPQRLTVSVKQRQDVEDSWDKNGKLKKAETKHVGFEELKNLFSVIPFTGLTLRLEGPSRKCLDELADSTLVLPLPDYKFGAFDLDFGARPGPIRTRQMIPPRRYGRLGVGGNQAHHDRFINPHRLEWDSPLEIGPLLQHFERLSISRSTCSILATPSEAWSQGLGGEGDQPVPFNDYDEESKPLSKEELESMMARLGQIGLEGRRSTPSSIAGEGEGPAASLSPSDLMRCRELSISCKGKGGYTSPGFENSRLAIDPVIGHCLERFALTGSENITVPGDFTSWFGERLTHFSLTTGMNEDLTLDLRHLVGLEGLTVEWWTTKALKVRLGNRRESLRMLSIVSNNGSSATIEFGEGEGGAEEGGEPAPSGLREVVVGVRLLRHFPAGSLAKCRLLALNIGNPLQDSAVITENDLFLGRDAGQEEPCRLHVEGFIQESALEEFIVSNQGCWGEVLFDSLNLSNEDMLASLKERLKCPLRVQEGFDYYDDYYDDGDYYYHEYLQEERERKRLIEIKKEEEEANKLLMDPKEWAGAGFCARNMYSRF